MEPLTVFWEKHCSFDEFVEELNIFKEEGCTIKMYVPENMFTDEQIQKATELTGTFIKRRDGEIQP